MSFTSTSTSTSTSTHSQANSRPSSLRQARRRPPTETCVVGQTIDEATPLPCMKSSTIPLPTSHIHRTDSELQLTEDTATAEWRDQCMFYRLVNGIRERQAAQYETASSALQKDFFPSGQKDIMRFVDDQMCQTEKTLENIILTRHRQDTNETQNWTTPNVSAAKSQEPSKLLPDVLHEGTRQNCPPTNDDWSVEGYDTPHADLLSQPQHSDVENEMEEDTCVGGVFSLDM